MRGLACGPEINKWDLFKLISICTAKEIINKIKQSMNWENIFANNATNKGLIKKTKQNKTVSSKKIHRWQIGMCKDAQLH